MSKDEAVSVWISSIGNSGAKTQSDNVEHILDKYGNPVFTYKRYSLVCDACADKKIMSDDQCPHNRHNRPTHQSARKMHLLECLMKASSRNEDYARESLAIDVGIGGQVFPPNLLEHAFRPQNVERIGTEFISDVFIAIDPCGGQNDPTMKGKSDFTIISMIPKGSRRKLVITGLDAMQVTSIYDFRNNVVQHVKKLLSFPGSSRAKVRWIYESNADLGSNYLVEYLAKNEHIIVDEFKEKGSKAGVRTSPETKRKMVKVMQELMLNDMISFLPDDQLFTTMQPSPYNTEACTPTTLKEKLKQQMGRFIEKRTPHADPTKKVSVSYSGKDNNQKDDMCMCAMILAYHSRVFYTHNI